MEVQQQPKPNYFIEKQPNIISTIQLAISQLEQCAGKAASERISKARRLLSEAVETLIAMFRDVNDTDENTTDFGQLAREQYQRDLPSLEITFSVEPVRTLQKSSSQARVKANKSSTSDLTALSTEIEVQQTNLLVVASIAPTITSLPANESHLYFDDG